MNSHFNNRIGKPIVVVLGPYRSGTSLVAGLLQQLGVDMGESFCGPRNPKGFFEDIELGGTLKRRFYPEPDLSQAVDLFEQVDFLRSWRIRRSGSSSASIIGAKHPILCLMVPQLRAAFGGTMKLIAVRRPLRIAIASMKDCHWSTWTSEKIERAQRSLYEQRQKHLEGDKSVLWLDYNKLLAEPKTHIENLISNLGLTPDESQKRDALNFIDPNLNHYGTGLNGV